VQAVFRRSVGDCKAGNHCPLAPRRIQIVLALEVATSWRSTNGAARNTPADPCPGWGTIQGFCAISQASAIWAGVAFFHSAILPRRATQGLVGRFFGPAFSG